MNRFAKQCLAEMSDEDRWRKSPAGAAKLAGLRSFFVREAKAHAPDAVLIERGCTDAGNLVFEATARVRGPVARSGKPARTACAEFYESPRDGKVACRIVFDT